MLWRTEIRLADAEIDDVLTLAGQGCGAGETAKAFSSPRRSKAETVWIILLANWFFIAEHGFASVRRQKSNQELRMSADLTNWTARPKPERIAMEGRYVRLNAQRGESTAMGSLQQLPKAIG